MKIKCVRCGAKSKMALCTQCLPPDATVQTVPVSSLRKSLPTSSELKSGSADAIDEVKQVFTQGRTWLKGNFKSYATFKNWNIAFDRPGLLTLAKDTALAALPLVIIGFVSAKLFISQVPELDGLPTGGLTKAAAFWMLNFALGIGLTISGNASVAFISGSGAGTIRLIASGLTVLLTYLLIRKSRARAGQANFTLNPQTEIIGTAALLSLFSFALTSLTTNAFSSSADVRDISASASVGLSVDFYSLFIGPLIISAIAVLLGSYAVKSKKKISDALNQSIAFLLGATAVATIVVVLLALKDREFSIIPVFLVLAPTLVLVGLSALSGVPLVNTGGEAVSLLSSSDGTPIDITQPSFSLVLYFALLLLALMLIGTVMGFRVDPRTFTARHSIRIILTITGIVLFLNFFFMFYAFGSASGAFGLASGSDSLAIFANPLLLLPASLIWGAGYLFGARYLTPFAAEKLPSLATKVLPKLRISISNHYLQTPEALDELTPLQKQTKTLQAAKAKSIAKKVAIVAAVFFFITGPANDFIGNKLSSPTSAVSSFFDALEANDAAAALSNVSLAPSDGSRALLTDKLLTNYIHKPKITAIEISQDGADYATAQVEYTLNGESHSAEVSLIKDSENKLFKIFPVWKISQDILRQVTTNNYVGATASYGDVAIPAETSSVFLFPGVVRYKYEDPIYSKEIDYTLLLSSYDDTNYEIRNAAIKADAETYIAKRVRAIISECNTDAENSKYSCPKFQRNWFETIQNPNLKTVENLQITNIQESNSGYSFDLFFDGQISYPDPTTGKTINATYNYNSTTYLNNADSFMAITWGG